MDSSNDTIESLNNLRLMVGSKQTSGGPTVRTLEDVKIFVRSSVFFRKKQVFGCLFCVFSVYIIRFEQYHLIRDPYIKKQDLHKSGATETFLVCPFFGKIKPLSNRI
jgi:hypothetical protein